jgi:hypothetical protein
MICGYRLGEPDRADDSCQLLNSCAASAREERSSASHVAVTETNRRNSVAPRRSPLRLALPCPALPPSESPTPRSAPQPSYEFEKLYGSVKAGKDDCATVPSSYGGAAKRDNLTESAFD